MAKANDKQKSRPLTPLDPAEAMAAARDALILEHEFSPLEKILPDHFSLGARFDACLAKRAGEDILVKAFLLDRGQAGETMREVAEVFRAALKNLFLPGRHGRVLAELIWVAGGTVADERWQGLASAPEGSFLSPVLVAKSCLELDPLCWRHAGRAKAWPGADWYLGVVRSGKPLEAGKLDEVLRGRSEQDHQARRIIFAGTPWATYTMIGLNLLAFVLVMHQAEELAGAVKNRGFNAEQMDLARMVAENEALKILGANSRDLVLGKGEWWRLLASMFLHFGPLHLAVNMVSLYSLGSLLERLGGARRFLLLYFATGLCGSLLGLCNQTGLPSVGASGAILGLAGCLMALRWKRPNDLPKAMANQVFRSLLQPTLIIFGLGLALQIAYWMGVRTLLLDNYAHLGGLASGLLFSLLFPLSTLADQTRRS